MLLLLISVYAKTYNLIYRDKPVIPALLTTGDRIVKETRLGFVLDLTEPTANLLRALPGLIIEEDKPVRIAMASRAPLPSFRVQPLAPWGLGQITGQGTAYEYIEDGGRDVVVYVLDTGIDAKHPEFEGRARMKFNAVEGSPNSDEQGHGTHCAGVIGGRTFGVAKGVEIVGVKVLDRHGEGSIARLVDGIDFVISDMHKNKKTVINMSVGGTRSEILNYTVEDTIREHGIHFSIAAGNENGDACGFSPSSAPTAVTVGASDEANRVAVFSNQGACVDLYAPGVRVLSAWPGGGLKLATGTSMAAPHVAGMMAIYLGLADFRPEELKRRLKMDSEGVVVDRGLLFVIGLRLPLASLKRLYARIKAVSAE